MAITVTLDETEFMGGAKVRHFDVQIVNYTDGGEVIPEKSLAMTRVQNVILTPAEGQVFSAGFEQSTNTLVADISPGEDAAVKMTVIGK